MVFIRVLLYPVIAERDDGKALCYLHYRQYCASLVKETAMPQGHVRFLTTRSCADAPRLVNGLEYVGELDSDFGDLQHG
jgi:hypothetical protein